MVSDYRIRRYASSVEFPEHVHSHIKPCYLGLVDEGNEGFFSPIAEHFPATYRQLCSGERVELMEVEMERTTGMGDQVIDRMYFWSVALSPSRDLILNIPRYDMLSAARQGVRDRYYGKLPASMSGFFHFMDGGKIAEFPVFEGVDFPRGYQDWATIYAYYASEKRLHQGDDIALADHLSMDEVRVVMTLRNRDFLACPLGSATPVLYLVRVDRPTSAELLESPEALLDRYLQRCLADVEDDTITLC